MSNAPDYSLRLSIAKFSAFCFDSKRPTTKLRNGNGRTRMIERTAASEALE